MELRLKRHTTQPSKDRTLGELFINGVKFCDTLEDTDRGLLKSMSKEATAKIKVFAKTCIGKGLYDIVINFSSRFGKLMPQLIDVVGFLGIRIHNGSYPEHTEGCILVGVLSGDMLIHSKDTFKAFMELLLKLPKKEKITILIE